MTFNDLVALWTFAALIWWTEITYYNGSDKEDFHLEIHFILNYFQSNKWYCSSLFVVSLFSNSLYYSIPSDRRGFFRSCLLGNDIWWNLGSQFSRYVTLYLLTMTGDLFFKKKELLGHQGHFLHKYHLLNLTNRNCKIERSWNQVSGQVDIKFLLTVTFVFFYIPWL